ncbi:MAG: prolipoprotein diacylglyceryl transferase family protein [Chloroflexota bacterium]
MPLAVISFEFDPVLHLGDLAVRWQTVALAAVVAAALIVAGLVARRTGLRNDDLVFIVVGIVPGAILGGRIGYALLHLDYYSFAPAALLDPLQGSLELGLAVVGGSISGAAVAHFLSGNVRRWLDASILPLLLALGAGKLALVLGGTGQGEPLDAAWATRYVGAGPWGSLAPGVASIPSQAIEGGATLAIVLAIMLLSSTGVPARGDGRHFFLGIAGWALVRAIVAATWRDVPIVGQVRADQLISIAIAAGAFLAAFLLWKLPRRTPPIDEGVSSETVAWPGRTNEPEV